MEGGGKRRGWREEYIRKKKLQHGKRKCGGEQWSQRPMKK